MVIATIMINQWKCADMSLDIIGWQADGNKSSILKAFSEFPSGVRKIIESADNPKVWDLYDMHGLPTWTRGHAAVIGDAAHPFQPCKHTGIADAGLQLSGLLTER